MDNDIPRSYALSNENSQSMCEISPCKLWVKEAPETFQELLTIANDINFLSELDHETILFEDTTYLSCKTLRNKTQSDIEGFSILSSFPIACCFGKRVINSPTLLGVHDFQ